jgi:hypothetical protein
MQVNEHAKQKCLHDYISGQYNFCMNKYFNENCRQTTGAEIIIIASGSFRGSNENQGRSRFVGPNFR